MIVDFHSHTNNSDGTLSTVALVGLMEARATSVYSITDHDSTRAYEELPEHRGRIIIGIEINSTLRERDVHILGYGFDLEGHGPIVETLAMNRAARRSRITLMIEQLRAAGYEITEAMVLAEADHAESLGRPHVAKALVRSKIVTSFESAFKDLLSRGGAGYVRSNHITPQIAIDAITRSGGIAVLAHPGRLREAAMLDELAEAGLAGIEVFYPTHTSAQTAYFREKARHHGLVMTAGSDFHDARYNGRTVGVDVADDDIAPFLKLVSERTATGAA